MLSRVECFDIVEKKYPGYALYSANKLKNGLYYFSLYKNRDDDFAAKSFTFDPETQKIEPFELLDTIDMDPETAKGYAYAE